MVELLVGIAILGILSFIAAPNLTSWVQNSQIRATADAMQNGLQLARAEAVRLNTEESFRLMTTTDTTCAASATSTSWVVSQGDPTLTPNKCATAATNTAVAANDPLIVQVRSGTEGSGNTTLVANQTLITFNGLGRVTNVPAGNVPPSFNIDVANATGPACYCPAGAPCNNDQAGINFATSGTMKCLRVVVTGAGQIRMCDPSLSQSANPKGC